MHLEHVNLTVADAERSAAFYSDLLGLHIRWKGDLGDGHGPLCVRFGQHPLCGRSEPRVLVDVPEAAL